MTSQATTVEQYLAELPEDRKPAIEAVLQVVRDNIQPDFEEGMQYGMIGFYVPHSIFPAGYHCDPKQPLPAIHIANQKNHMSLYMFCLYTDPETQHKFEKAYLATGKKLDMGKSCVRFKKLENLPLEVIGQAVRDLTVDDFIASYKQGLKR